MAAKTVTSSIFLKLKLNTLATVSQKAEATIPYFLNIKLVFREAVKVCSVEADTQVGIVFEADLQVEIM